jgi:CAAX prenyl protease-like protein
MEHLTPADSPSSKPGISDEVAYVLPMAIFLALTAVAGKWPALYPVFYTAKALLTAIALVWLATHYTRISWTFAWLGLLVGAIGIVQWVGMQALLERQFEFFRPKADAFNPWTAFGSHSTAIAFIAIRIASAVLVVPFMEELFWRDFLWRQILAPNNFKLAGIGEAGLAPLLIVSGAFATVHGNWWPTAIVWALMIGGLLIYTRSLGACIVAHATTNLLLAIYVLHYHAWSLW